MALVLGEAKYNETKKLLDSGLYNREEIAQIVHMSHTIVSRVNNTESYEEYLKKFNLKPELATLNFAHKATKSASKPRKKIAPKKTVKPAPKVVSRPKKNWFNKIKEFFRNEIYVDFCK